MERVLNVRDLRNGDMVRLTMVNNWEASVNYNHGPRIILLCNYAKFGRLYDDGYMAVTFKVLKFSAYPQRLSTRELLLEQAERSHACEIPPHQQDRNHMYRSIYNVTY